MIDERTRKDLKEFIPLEEPLIRIYIMLNESGKVKIGKTKDIYKRYQSLCGSNGQGVAIEKVCVSPQTFLFTIERIMHNKFEKYRIPNTEWFYDEENSSGEKLFNDAVNELKLLFSSTEYKICNNIRKSVYENMSKKSGGENDH